MGTRGEIVDFAQPVFNTLRHSGLDPDLYVVVGGAALALHGIRAANDVDIVVGPGTFCDLEERGQTPGGISLVNSARDCHVLSSVGESETVCLGLDLVSFSNDLLDEFRSDAVTFSDHNFALNCISLQKILALKAGVISKKSRRDVELITDHLAKETARRIV